LLPADESQGKPVTDSLELCDQKRIELDALRPLSHEVERRVLQKLRLDWNYHSNHLEGNSLSYGETRALILHGLTAQGKPLKDHFEITGHNEAILWVEDLVQKRQPLTEAVIRQLHTLILKEDHHVEAQTEDGVPTRLLVEVGKYKTLPNHVKTITGEIVFFTTPLDTPQEMQELMEWYRTSEENPVLLASLFHYRLIRIHPFSDGNGRVARLVMNFILMMHGFPPVIVKTEEKNLYLSALRAADAGEIQSFVEYVAANLVKSLDLMLSAARGESIEEPNDIEKELALLKQRFQGTGEVLHSLKSKELVAEAWVGWIGPWFKEFDARLKQAFSSFYLKEGSTVFVDNVSVDTQSSIDIQLDMVELKLTNDLHSLMLSVKFETLRKVGHDDFSQSSFIHIDFLSTHISITTSGENERSALGYGRRPDEIQLRKWTDGSIREHMDALKQWLEENS
jgi:Fic family protein